MRRKSGMLVPIERAICTAAEELLRNGMDEFHGYQLASLIGRDADHRLLTAYGTLYRALARLEDMGLLQSRREEPEIPARENRPGRRLYRLTPNGQSAAAAFKPQARIEPSRRRRRTVPA